VVNPLGALSLKITNKSDVALYFAGLIGEKKLTV
jgi:hypothetical protein